jgi:tetratricopeptide (TPR) repeat protein
MGPHGHPLGILGIEMNQWFENRLVAFSLIGALTALIYFNSLQVPFHFDDVSNIISNPSIHLEHFTAVELKKAMDSNRPVTDLSFALNYYTGGLSTLGYHLVNIAIHAFTGCAVYLFILFVLGQSSAIPALLGGLLWTAHPVQIQAVTYVVQRATSLSTLFFLLTLLLYIWGRPWTGWRRFLAYLGLLTSALVAIGSKQTAAPIPLMIVLYEYYFGSKFNSQVFRQQVVKVLLPLFAGVLPVLLVYFWVFVMPAEMDFSSLVKIFTRNYANEYYPMWERLLTEFRVVVFYLSLLLLPVPSRLNIQHDFSLSSSLFVPASTFLSFLTILGLIFLAIRVAKVYPAVSFGILWFFITTAMESFIFKLDLAYEHRLYLPSIGFILILCFFLQKGLALEKPYSSKSLKLAFVSLSIATIGLFSLWTIQRNVVWQDQVAIWKDAIKKSPQSARARNNLGVIYMSRGQIDLAVEAYQQAVRLMPSMPVYYENLSKAYERQGRLDLAIALFEKIIQVDPKNARAYYHLGRIYERLGRLEEAREALTTSVRLQPRLARAYAILGSIHVKLGEFREAAEVYESVLRLLGNREFTPGSMQPLALPQMLPDKPAVHYALGQVYEKLGRTDLAITHYRKALHAFPSFLPVRLDLARLYVEQRQLGPAKEQYKKILQEDPSHIDTHFYLAFVYEMEGDPKNAAAYYRKFLDLAPEDSYYGPRRQLAYEWLEELRDKITGLSRESSRLRGQ